MSVWTAVRYLARLLRIVQKQAVKRRARLHLSKTMDPEWQEWACRRNLKRTRNTSFTQLRNVRRNR